jgi:hypothetical protein
MEGVRGTISACDTAVLPQRCTSKLFFKVCKSQIRNFLSSFRYRKSARFFGVPVRKSQIRLFKRFFILYFELEHFVANL